MVRTSADRAPLPNQRLKEIRRSRGLTAFALAQAVGVRETTIYRYEAGKNPPLHIAQQIARCLNSTIDELFPTPDEASA